MYDIKSQLVHGLRSCGPIIILVTLIGTFFAFQDYSFPVLRGGAVIAGRNSAEEVDVSSVAVKWEEVKRRAEVKNGKTQWIVAATSQPPTPSLRQLADRKDWQLLVLGQVAGLEGWDAPIGGAIYLSLQDQKESGYRVTPLLLPGSFPWRNIGYLYAIEAIGRLISLFLIPPPVNQRGAETIYETSDDVNLLFQPNGTGPPFHLNLDIPILLGRGRDGAGDGSHLLNPYIHFKQPKLWPRGLPLEEASRKLPLHVVRTQPVLALIQQGLISGESRQLDSYLRLALSHTRQQEGILIDPTTPPIALSPSTMSPITADHILFHREALWALLLPSHMAPPVSDIWRGYWAQRLIWTIGGSIAFFPPLDSKVHSPPPPPLPPLDLTHEAPLYFNTSSLLSFLVNWQPHHPFDTRLPDVILSLTADLAREGFWSRDDVALTSAWLQDLMSVGYKFPNLTKAGIGVVEEEGGESVSVVEGENKEAVVGETLEEELQKYLTQNSNNDTVSEEDVLRLSTLKDKFRNTVLIVSYNSGALCWRSLDFWRVIYGRVFGHVEVVSPNVGTDNPDVVEVPLVFRGYFNYRIVPTIFARHPSADGFLFATDDMLLNYWTLADADITKFWFLGENHKEWAAFEIGKEAIKHVWYTAENVQNFMASAYRAMPTHYLQQLQDSLRTKLRNGENASIAYPKAVSDSFYIPRRHVGAVEELLPIFMDRGVYSEMAIPTIFFSIEDPASYDSKALTTLTYTWFEKRKRPWLLYSHENSGFHPWKTTTTDQMRGILTSMAKGDPTLKKLIPSICVLKGK